MKRTLALAVLALGIVLTACRDTSSGLVVGVGSVQAWGGDCTGMWILHADSGRNYELIGLPSEFQKQDLRVRFTLKLHPDHVSGCMVGPGADVISMRPL
jgi:hypothetical protein